MNAKAFYLLLYSIPLNKNPISFIPQYAYSIAISYSLLYLEHCNQIHIAHSQKWKKNTFKTKNSYHKSSELGRCDT